jgi:hypothetical protein
MAELEELGRERIAQQQHPNRLGKIVRTCRIEDHERRVLRYREHAVQR